MNGKQQVQSWKGRKSRVGNEIEASGIPLSDLVLSCLSSLLQMHLQTMGAVATFTTLLQISQITQESAVALDTNVSEAG